MTQSVEENKKKNKEKTGYNNSMRGQNFVSLNPTEQKKMDTK